MGIFFWTLLRPVFSGLNTKLILCVSLIFALTFTERFSWGRISYGRNLIEAPIPSVAPHALVFIMGSPLGFVVQQLQRPDNNFIRVDDYDIVPQEAALITRRLAGGSPPELLTDLPPDAKDAALTDGQISQFGLRYQDDCVRIYSPVQIPDQHFMRLCTLARAR